RSRMSSSSSAIKTVSFMVQLRKAIYGRHKPDRPFMQAYGRNGMSKQYAVGSMQKGFQPTPY
ncbi:MAG: hypothetical protein NTY44_01090, partial [Deltaproteobacteria bacterium]|nr:hypothetical protein [Deltaproteobacteria bacterium]